MPIGPLTTREQALEHSTGNQVVDGDRVYRVAKGAIDEAFAQYNIPLQRDRVEVVAFDYNTSYRRAMGTAIAYGCREIETASEPSRWIINGEPDGYVVMVYAQTNRERTASDIRGTTRHELAHIINWELDGVTHEGERNHAEWLDYLDAPR